MRDPVPQTILLADYAPPPYLIKEIELDFDIREEHTVVRARTRVERNPHAPGGTDVLFLHGDELELLHAAVDGRALEAAAYRVSPEGLSLPGVPGACTLD